MKPMVKVASVLLGSALALLSGTSAEAAEEAVDPHIAAVLTEVPGGVIIDANRAVWPELGMEMTVQDDSRMTAYSAVGSCSSGYLCAFSSSNLGGSKLSWTYCGTHSVPSHFTVRSIANARSSGRLEARNGSTVLATAYAGGWSNVSGGPTTNVRCLY